MFRLRRLLFMLVLCPLLFLFGAVQVWADLQAPSWWDLDGISLGSDWHYRVPIEIQAGNVGELVAMDVDFGPGAGSLLDDLGVSGDFDEISPRITRADGTTLLSQQQFDDGSYGGGTDPSGNGSGAVVFTLEDDAPVIYYLYFDIAENGTKPAPSFGNPTILTNGGFETGDLTGWVPGGPGDHKVSTTQVHAGSYSALIGFRDANIRRNKYDYVYQTVTVPASGATLSFWYRFLTYDSDYYDYFEMWIRSSAGSKLTRVVHSGHNGSWGGLHDLGWQQVSYDLSSYAGQTIQLYFQVANRWDTAYRSWAYVDEVSLGIEPTSVTMGRSEGFGIEVTTITNESNTGGPLRCGDVVGFYATSDVGLYLDNSTGRTLEAVLRDAQGVEQATIALYDDGTHGDTAGNDGVWTNSMSFAIPTVLGSNGGSWEVELSAGSATGGYDNGYLAQDGASFRVEGLKEHPDPLAMSVCQGDSAQVNLKLDNLGQGALVPVKARMTSTLSDGVGHTIPDMSVTSSLGSGEEVATAATNYPVTITVSTAVGQATGVYTGTLTIYEDENGNDVVDDCIQSSCAFSVTVVDCGSAGGITPKLQNGTSVQPCPCEDTHNIFYTYNFSNQNIVQDRANLSLVPDSTQGWKVEIYRDILGNTITGTHTVTPTNFSDDVLLAYDNNGDGGSGGWDYVNPVYDTGLDGIPDTGDLAANGDPGDDVNLTMVVYVPCEAVAGTADTTTFRGSSHNDWQGNHPGDPYDDDGIFYDFGLATTSVDANPCGMITPRDLSLAVDPCHMVYFIQRWEQLGAAGDRGNISIENNPGGFPVRVWRDSGLNDVEGVYSSAAWKPDSNDLLIAEDTDGDGDWDWVNGAYDTGSDGVPDTGDLSPYGGYTHIIVGVDVPCNCSPNVIVPDDYDINVRGSSNNHWVGSYPSLDFNDETIYHDEVVNRVTVNQITDITLASDESLDANPGQAADYTLSVTNDGNVADTVDFTVAASSSFTVTLYESDGSTLLTDHDGDGDADVTVGPCADVNVTVVISVPIGTGGDVSQTTNVTATSSNDVLLSSGVTLTTTATTEVAGLINFTYMEQTVYPRRTAYYCQEWANGANITDWGNISTYPDQGWPLSIYLDVNGDNSLGIISGLSVDDVLLAADVDGNGVWDYVNPVFDTGSDGVPDSGTLVADPDGPGPQTGGSVQLVFAVSVPEGTVAWTRDGTLVRGSSNIDWQMNHPTIPYNDDAIYHDDVLLGTLAQELDIAVTKWDWLDPLCSGWHQSYTVMVTNSNGISVTGVVISDVIPLLTYPLLTECSSGASWDEETRTISWDVGTLTEYESRTVIVRIGTYSSLAEGDVITNVVTTISDQAPPVMAIAETTMQECAAPTATPTSVTATPSPTATATPTPEETVPAPTATPTFSPTPMSTLTPTLTPTPWYVECLPLIFKGNLYSGARWFSEPGLYWVLPLF